ncbi:MAG: hypothetical protein A2758_01805 [Candidatus Zambryskibacteria bacterium RIFCSPHIGHO2_01_FULL_49_18]|uniref:Uncharacterized protein n=1 Tax=Candidatus Zambryskibacteria bacterium RIFCSPHIGHO2_01_FULL_49_18 TaxID=1802740 RepID=A0A1G2T2F7_9BACT|nr:MAG: hypothetical protein A2758_01805 [Candidatus Zambryskibacteria bacterium RIFCSPHIGHO2_01_FULL_49_18]
MPLPTAAAVRDDQKIWPLLRFQLKKLGFLFRRRTSLHLALNPHTNRVWKCVLDFAADRLEGHMRDTLANRRRWHLARKRHEFEDCIVAFGMALGLANILVSDQIATRVDFRPPAFLRSNYLRHLHVGASRLVPDNNLTGRKRFGTRRRRNIGRPIGVGQTFLV